MKWKTNTNTKSSMGMTFFVVELNIAHCNWLIMDIYMEVVLTTGYNTLGVTRTLVCTIQVAHGSIIAGKV